MVTSMESWSNCATSLSPSLGPSRLLRLHTDPIRDNIVSVTIKHGDLVDSITLSYSSGRVVKAGGSGGSTSQSYSVDSANGERVVGFFGGNYTASAAVRRFVDITFAMHMTLGVGGHIHHFGVIIASSNIFTSRKSDTFSPDDKLLFDLATKHKLWDNCIPFILQKQVR